MSGLSNLSSMSAALAGSASASTLATSSTAAPTPAPTIAAGATIISYRPKQFSAKETTLVQLIGEGQMSYIYSGKVQTPMGDTSVAIKKAKSSTNNQRHLATEIALFIKLRSAGTQSPYVIRFIGLCVGFTPPAMALELADDCLENLVLNSTSFPWANRTLVLREVGLGIEYLHTNGIIHRDIKSANILLVKGHAKISDLGLATLASNIIDNPGSFPWAAPESIDMNKQKGKHCFVSDVYSFGMLTLELLSLKLPPANPFYFQIKPDKKEKILIEKDRLGEDCPKAYQILRDIVRMCSIITPSDRPIMRKVNNTFILEFGELAPAPTTAQTPAP